MTMMTLATNETSHSSSPEGKKELPLSEDSKAFNEYLSNIARMTRKDIHEQGHQKQDFFALCSWQGNICNPRHFSTFQDITYGNCFTLNTSLFDTNVKGTGHRNGLSLSLYIEQNEYLDRVAPAAGARIVIHDSDQKPFPGDEGFIVAAGHTTSVYLSKSTSETVKPMCDPDVETYLYKHNGSIYKKYSQKACIKQCLSNEILRQCNCTGRQFLLDVENRCSLNNQQEEHCVQRLEGLAKRMKLPCSCPVPCRTSTYNPTISSAVWPAEKYLSSFIEELNRVKHKAFGSLQNVTDLSQFVSENFLRVDIFFKDLTEEEIIQRHAYDVKRLISDIGGQLGLWIGVSVATLYQLVHTISAFLAFIFKLLKTRKQGRRIGAFKASATNVAKSYKVASTNSLALHWTLATTGSSTSTKFLKVHFEMDEHSPKL